MKKRFNYILFLVAICLLWSCSTRKNTKASRFYHAFTSNYNIYFNGKTSFDESLDMMQKSHKESYTDMILMYPISAQPKEKTETGGPFDRAIEKGNKAIKLHSIKAKPPKKPGWRNNPKQRALQEQEEYNPFLKKCWLLVGQGQFYNADFLQASATFSYIARHYSQDPEMVAEAKLWQARCYSEMNWLYESEDILQKLNTNGIPKNNMNRYAAVNADYLIKNQQFEEAIPYLKTAIKGEKNRRQRTRMKYLLGQIYADQGLEGLAFQTFGEVARANPPYDLELAARIRQTEVFTGSDYQKMVKMLQRMAKSQKNTEFLDQVYYAIGNIYISRQDTVKAIENYEIAIEESTMNGMDKAICQIRLGDIYFKQHDYMRAQPCFSGALAIIKKEYKEYERVAKLSAVLDELVVHVEAVHLQDSLQVLAKMPESERLAVIDKIIEKIIKEEKEAKELADKEAFLAEQASQGGLDRPGMDAPAMNIPTAGSGSFYFYNPQTVSQGKTQFQRKWGKRVLEDDWRRRDKKVSTFMESGNDDIAETGTTPKLGEDGLPLPTDSLDTEGLEELASDPKTREFYLQQIPLTEEDIAASNLIIIDGLYNMAMIYKDKLEDLPLSVEAFDELERRFPDNEHLLESYYQVYLMSLRAEDHALAAEVKSKLIRKFPDSDYAVAIANPNYLYNIRMMDKVQDSLYVSTYEQYLAENTRAVRSSYKEVSEKYPLAKLLPKFMFLEALTYVQEGDPEGFKNALKTLVEKYPQADVTELAGEMLKGVLRGRTMMQGGVKGMAYNIRFGLGEDGELSAADSARMFNAEPQTPYRLVLMYPTGSIDKNQLLFTVAAYNFANFMVKEFDLSIEENGPLSMLMIRGFVNLDEVIQYYKMIHGETGYGKVLGGAVALVPISEDNFETLMRGKTLEEYITFFEEHFGKKAPEIATRMKARILEEANAEEPLIELPESENEEEKVEEPTPIVEQPKETPAKPKKEEEKKEEEHPIEEVITTEPVEEKKEEAKTPVVVPEIKEKAPVEKELTLKEIEALRKREAEEAEAKKEEARKEFETQQKIEKELQEQKKKEQEELIKRQKAEEAALLKAKAENEKKLQQDKKDKQKQVEAERKAKQKAREELSKQKEREYKERQKQKEKERREKERANKERLKQKEKERREALKAKEAAAKKR